MVYSHLPPSRWTRLGSNCEEARNRSILACTRYWKEVDAAIERKRKLRKINRDIKRAKASGDKAYLDELIKSSISLRSKEACAIQILASLRGLRDLYKHIAAEEAWKFDLFVSSNATAAVRKFATIPNSSGYKSR